MRTFVFVMMDIALSLALFLNIINIGFKLGHDKPMGSAVVAVLTNIGFILGVCYLYNTSYGA